MKDSVELNDVNTVNCGQIEAGNTLSEPKPTVTTVSRSTTHFDSVTGASDLENKDKIIIGVAVLSSLLVLILVYLIVIRPYLKRKAKTSTEEPIDTSRAPMDLTFRPPARKQNCFNACFFCKQ